MAKPKERRRRARRPGVAAFARACGKGFDLLFLQSPLPMWIYGARTGRFLEVNEAALRIYGYSRDEFLSSSLYDIRPAEDCARLADELGHQRSGAGFRESRGWRHVRRDGSVMWVDIHSQELQTGGEPIRLAIVNDVTALKKSEGAVARLYRISTVLGGINGLIVRTRSREELFRESCRLAVELGGFRMAWIAVLDGDTVRPAACCSSTGTPSLDSLCEVLKDGLPADGPTAVALREGQIVACDDIAAPHRFAAWLERAQVPEARSCLVQPLFVGERVAGSLSLYADDASAFAGEEQKLLAEVASNISYSMEFIARDEQLDYVAFYDPVTRLANRRLLLERLTQSTRTARETRQRLAVLLLDIERFATVNSAFGREGGDAVLTAVGERLQIAAGGPANVARVGGDQFAIVLPLLRSLDDLTRTLQDPVWNTLGGPIRLGETDLQLYARLGASVFPDDGEDADALLRNAEAALRHARATGDRFLLYTKEMTEAVRERHLLEVRLRHALEHGEFVLHYQPKVDARSGVVSGAEALIRWNSPDLGLVPPDRFIPVLEETGLIVEVGRQALVEAVAALSRWKFQGVAPIPLSVNVSPVQLRQPGFVQMIKDAIGARADTDPLIQLELTESMLLGDTDAVVRRLRRIRAMGVSIAIDDFGTGYSSLSYLSTLPIDTIKIDRSFVSGLADRADTVSIVASIVSLAHSMGFRVVAEGVETSEQLRFLGMLECDELQGFLISKALPEAEFVALLRQTQHLPAGEATWRREPGRRGGSPSTARPAA